MDWLHSHRRTASICGLTLLLPVLVYLSLLSSAWGLRADYVEQIEDLKPRIARMRGLLQVEDELRGSARDAQQKRTRLVYPASADQSAVAASLQTDIRRLMRDAGLSVSDSQVMPVREEDSFDYISVKLTVSGDLASLDRALADLAEFKPLVIVESADIWPTRVARSERDETQEVTASLQLLSLRARI